MITLAFSGAASLTSIPITLSLNEGSRITHVLVSERISGSKAEKFLRGATKAFTKNGKKKVVLVDCEWAFYGRAWVRLVDDQLERTIVAGVLDSVREGKKLSEAAYHVIENEVSRSFP